MSAKDIWYGVLEAGEKSSPVVRDSSIESRESTVYVYNYIRNQFIEYTKAIMEPRLRELTAADISQDELDKAFKAARRAFMSSRKVRTWTGKKPAAQHVKKEDEDNEPEFDMAVDDDMEDFIDDD